jgi:ADYC domain
MAMADYCGDGRSWTRDGTLIQRWDRLLPPAQARTRIDPRMTFEAAWTPRGAACLAHPRWTGLAQDFRPERCAKALPACGSEEEAVRDHGGILLFNAS